MFWRHTVFGSRRKKNRITLRRTENKFSNTKGKSSESSIVIECNPKKNSRERKRQLFIFLLFLATFPVKCTQFYFSFRRLFIFSFYLPPSLSLIFLYILFCFANFRWIKIEPTTVSIWIKCAEKTSEFILFIYFDDPCSYCFSGGFILKWFSDDAIIHFMPKSVGIEIVHLNQTAFASNFRW